MVLISKRIPFRRGRVMTNAFEVVVMMVLSRVEMNEGGGVISLECGCAKRMNEREVKGGDQPRSEAR